MIDEKGSEFCLDCVSKVLESGILILNLLDNISFYDECAIPLFNLWIALIAVIQCLEINYLKFIMLHLNMAVLKIFVHSLFIFLK